MSFDIKHHFCDGVYIREQYLQAAGVVQTHRHTYDHFGILVKGSAAVECDGKGITHDAPAIITIKAGVEHRIEALTAIEWLCVHRTDITDAAEIDAALIKGD